MTQEESIYMVKVSNRIKTYPATNIQTIWKWTFKRKLIMKKYIRNIFVWGYLVMACLFCFEDSVLFTQRNLKEMQWLSLHLGF